MTEKEAQRLPLEDDEFKDVPVKIMTWGRNGKCDLRSLKVAHEADVRGRETADYREIIPCVMCKNCMILRGWERGKLVTRWYFCRQVLTPVDKYGTCKFARERPRNWNRGIFVDMAGAPRNMPQTIDDIPRAMEVERQAAIEAAKAVMAEQSGYMRGADGMKRLKERLDKIEEMEGGEKE